MLGFYFSMLLSIIPLILFYVFSPPTLFHTFQRFLKVSRIDWVSSTYDTSLVTVCFPVPGSVYGSGIPIMFSVLRIAHASGSACKIYSKGLMGHPCRIERDILKYSLRNPFVNIDAFAFLKIILVQD